MADCVMTGWTGVAFAQIAAHTLPRIAAYAERHGMACGCANLAGDRPPSWMKVAAIGQALQSHDRVCWIDADVVIARDDANILNELRPGTWQALVAHHTECGEVPNCGVWVLTQHMLPVLEEIWDAGQDIDHPWWEQASMLRRMGYAVTRHPTSLLDTPTTLYERTTFLNATWNHHPHDVNRVADPRFIHVTRYDDRIELVRHLCSGARFPAAATG